MAENGSPSNLIELEKMCQDEWENLPKSRCVKFVGQK